MMKPLGKYLRSINSISKPYHLIRLYFFYERSEANLKRILAFFLALVLAFCNVGIGFTEQQPVTPTDLEPAIVDVIDEPSAPTSDFTPNLSNLNQFNIVALNNFLQQGHVRGSVWVGGTMTGGPYMFVDDGSIGGSGAHTSYVYNNQSEVQFKGRTSEQSLTAYMGLTDTAVTANANYWYSVYNSLGDNGETCIYDSLYSWWRWFSSLYL